MAEGLPKIPGYTFSDVTRTQFQRTCQFDFRNGYRFPSTQPAAMGKKEHTISSVAFLQKDDTCRFDPSLTYGRTKSRALPKFTPYYEMYANKCLTFKAFFKQSVFESSAEHYRIRHVNIVYFLEDDSILVTEPKINDAGFPQGRYLKRTKNIPKNDLGESWNWKDFDVGMDVAFYGTVFHIYDADSFTREYMRSQGIELKQREDLPPDPYIQNRLMANALKTKTTPLVDDKLRRFLEYDGKILKFDCVLDDRDSENPEMREYVMSYFLADDTVTIKEILKRNDGREPFPIFLKKTKLPKNWKDVPTDYPSCYQELSDAEVTEYYQPKDFLVGETIFVFGRRFLLTDCDQFTRNYFKKMLDIEQKPKIDIRPPPPQPIQKQIPPHVSKIGSFEDSLVYCFKLNPARPKVDEMTQLINMGKVLRYSAKMVSPHPEDSIREFIIIYMLESGKIQIVEPPIRNSGIRGGTFLRRQYVPKPNTDPDCPEFYTPADFYINAKITVYKHIFQITGCDLRVYRYVKANKEKFPQHVIENIRNYMYQNGYLKDEIDGEFEEQQEKQRMEEIKAIGSTLETKEPDPCLKALIKTETQPDPYQSTSPDFEMPLLIRKDPIQKPPAQMYGIPSPVTDCRYPPYIGKEIMSTDCNRIRNPTQIPCCLKPDCPVYSTVKDKEDSKIAYYKHYAEKHKELCDNAETYYNRPCPNDEPEVSKSSCPERDCSDTKKKVKFVDDPCRGKQEAQCLLQECKEK